MVEAETHCSTHSPAHPWCCNWQECQLIFFQGFDVPVGCQEQNLLARCSSQQWKKLFQDSADQPKKKRKLMKKNGIVHLDVGDHKVHCWMFGQRPTRSDLAILFDPNHLEPVILHFRNAGPANLQAKKWSKSNDDTD